MADYDHLTPEVGADVLHAHMDQHIQSQKAANDGYDHEPFEAVLNHPNVDASHIEKLYNHIKPVGNTDEFPRGALSDIASHSKTPKNIAHDILQSSFSHERYDDMASVHASAIDNPNVDPEMFGHLADRLVNGEGARSTLTSHRWQDHSGVVMGYPLKLDKIKQLREQRPAPEPESDTMTDEQKASNRKAGIIDTLAAHGYAKNKSHTPESLTEAVDFFSSPVDEHLKSNSDQFSGIRAKFIADQNLTPQHIEKLFNASVTDNSRGQRYWGSADDVEAAASHKNIDPAFLTKLASGKHIVPGANDKYMRDARRSALKNPALPPESRKAIIEGLEQEDIYNAQTYSSDLLENPGLSGEEVTALARYDHKQAMLHDKAPDALIHSFYDKSPDKETADKVLSRKQLPESILLKLINHKNQDVAVSALSHPSTNRTVLEAALKRRAVKLQTAAKTHPLMINDHLVSSLNEGKIDPHRVLLDPTVKIKEMSPEVQKSLHESLIKKGNELNPQLNTRSEEHNKHFDAKLAFIGRPEVSPELKEQHTNDMLAQIEKHGVSNLSDYQDRNDPRNVSVGSAREYLDKLIKVNPAAKNWATKSPENAAFYGKLGEETDGQTIRHIHDMLMANDPRGLSDYRGQPFNLKTFRESLETNPSTPVDVLDKFISSDEFLDKHIDESNNRRSYGYDNPIDQMVGHKRYGYHRRDEEDPNKEQRRQEVFGKFLAMQDPRALKLIVGAKSAPKEIFSQALEALPEEERAAAFSNDGEHIANSADPEQMIRFLGDPELMSQPESRVMPVHILNSMKDKPEHARRAMDTFLSNSANDDAYTESLHTNKSAKLFEGADHPSAVALISKAQASDNHWWMAGDLTSRYAENLMDRSNKEDPPGAYAHSLLALMPQVQSDPSKLASSWANAIKNSKPNLVRGLKGKADWMVDQIPDESGLLKDALLKHSLLSPEKASEIIAADAGSWAESYRSSTTKKEMLQAYLGSPGLKPEMTSAIAENFKEDQIQPGYVRGSMSDKDYGQTSANLQSLVSTFANQMDQSRSGEMIATVLGKLETNMGTRQTKMTKKDTQKLIKEAVSSIATLPISEDQKSRIYAGIYSKKPDLLPQRVIAQIAKKAETSGDIVSLFAMGSKSSGAMTSAVKTFESAATLNEDEVYSGINAMTSHGSRIGASNAKRITNKIFASTEDAGIHQAACEAMIQTLDSSDAASVKSVSEATFKVAAANPEMKDDLYAQLLLKDRGMNPALSKKLFTQIEHTGYIDANLRFTDEFLKDPEIIENSQSGWKLGLMVHNFSSLSTGYKNIIFKRAAGQPDTVSPSKIVKFAIGDSTLDQAAVKEYFRASPDAAFSALEQSGTFMKPNEINLESIVDACIEHSQQVESSGLGTAVDNYQHVKNAQALMSAGLYAQNRDGYESLHQEKKFALKRAFDRGMELAEKNLEGSIAGDNGHLVTKFVGSLADRGIRKLDEVETQKVYGIIKKLEMHVPGGPAMLAANLSAAYSNVIARGEYSAEFLKTAVSEKPAVMFSVVQRETLGKKELEAIDLQKINEYQTKAIHGPNALSDLAPSDRHSDLARQFMRHAIDGLDRTDPESCRIFMSKALSQLDTFKRGHGDPRTYVDLAEKYFERLGTAIDYDHLSEFTEGAYHDSQNIKNKIMVSAVKAGAGGEKALQEFMYNFGKHGGSARRDFETATKSPHYGTIEPSVVISTLKNIANAEDHESIRIFEQAIDNDTTHSDVLSFVYQQAKEKESRPGARNLIAQLTERKNCPEHIFKEAYEQTKDQFVPRPDRGEGFHPALKNRTHGGALFRSLPVAVPEQVTMNDPQALIHSTGHSMAAERLEAMAAVIPPEGITWANFKKANPKMENLPQVKAVFQAKNNKPVTVEDVHKAIKNSAGAEFHVTYGMWGGAQRHQRSGAPNLVMQLNTSEKMQKELGQDPDLWDFYSMIQESANYSGHPTTPHGVSWVRLDTSAGKEGMIIEEFQSDFDQRLPSKIREEAEKIEQQGVGRMKWSKEEMLEKARKIRKSLDGWVESSFKGSIELAKKQGVKYIYMHGLGVRGHLSGHRTDREEPAYFKEIYELMPSKYGFEKCDYADYPNHNKDLHSQIKSAGRDTYCWRLKIS